MKKTQGRGVTWQPRRLEVEAGRVGLRLFRKQMQVASLQDERVGQAAGREAVRQQFRLNVERRVNLVQQRCLKRGPKGPLEIDSSDEFPRHPQFWVQSGPKVAVVVKAAGNGHVEPPI